jgi:phage gp37-like protein
MTINRLNQDVTYLPAFRNLIINGAMQVAQRGTSTASITTEGYYTSDRWLFTVTNQGTWTQSVENDAPTGSGFRKSTKLLCTTADASPAAADTLVLIQRIEGQNLQQIAKGTSSAKQLTLSFWVKSNVTGTYIVELGDADNTRQVSKSYTINASATWEKKTITFPADTTGAFDNDNGSSLSLLLWLGAGSDRTSGTLNTSWASTVNANRVVGQTNLAAATNNYWQVTGVQLEVGAVATPFEFKPIEQELAECQRYYYRITGGGTFSAVAHLINATNSTSGQFVFPTKVDMRVAPTAVEFSNLRTVQYNTTGGGVAQTITSITTTADASYGFIMGSFAVASGLIQGFAGWISNSNNTAGYLGFSAEL